MSDKNVIKQAQNISASARAEKWLFASDFDARRVNNAVEGDIVHNAEDYHSERQKIVNSLFSYPEAQAMKKFAEMRPSLKKLFSGSERNNIERILAALLRMSKEGYDTPRDLMRDRAKTAAMDNSQLADFLNFVPVKIPYCERNKQARTA